VTPDGFAVSFKCPICGKPLTFTDIVRTGQVDIQIISRCLPCRKKITIRTTFKEMLEQILDELEGE
jgi:hypothetical protein